MTISGLATRVRTATRAHTLAAGVLAVPAAYAQGAQGYTFTTIAVPGARATFLRGINAAGEIIGTYANNIGGPAFGFVAAPTAVIPEPGPLALVAVGLSAIGAAVRRGRSA